MINIWPLLLFFNLLDGSVTLKVGVSSWEETMIMFVIINVSKEKKNVLTVAIFKILLGVKSSQIKWYMTKHAI